MTIKDKIYETIHLEIYKNESDCIDGIQDAANGAEKIAEEFAIEFLSWTNTYKYYALKTNKDLLKMYKKEKGL